MKDYLFQIKLLIFDIDGVLVDVRSSYRLAIKKTVEYFYHKEIHSDEIQELKNESGFNNDWDLTQELLKRKNLHPSRESIIERFQSFYWGNEGDGLIQSEKWLLDKHLLKLLSQKYLLAIFTGRPRLEAEFVLKKNEVRNYFLSLIAMEDVTSGKPDPEGLKIILKNLSIPPKKACYFGDTFDDIRCARSAQVLPIGVIPPSGKDELIPQFEQEGAYAVFKDINDISQYIT